MSPPILYVAITNHGFGHATRTAAVVAEIQRRCPEIMVILTTTAPRWLLEEYISEDFVYRPRSFDIGVVQSDSITQDQGATLDKLREIRDRSQSIILSESNFLKQNRVGLVLADIPPLAAPIAQAAGVPCWMMSNFGWDFIYRAWGGEFIEMADWIGECFSKCDRLFRLPFHEPMSAFSQITDVGLIGGTPRFPLEDLRQKYNLTAPKERTVLLTFGGMGLHQVPWENLSRFPDWQFITFDAKTPQLPNLKNILDRSCRPVDLMPLCRCVISKPGFGTFSEACGTDTPIISITRDDFAEAAVLLEGIRDYAEHFILTPQEFLQGDWQWLRQPLQAPGRNELLDKQGNGAIAQSVVDYFNR